MQKKVLVLGSINKDLVVSTKNFPKEGQTIFGNSFQTYNGGKGANQASAIAKLGGDTTIFGALGDDSFGKELLKDLKQIGVNTQNILIKKEAPTGIAMITLNSKGANHIIVVQGANALLEEKDLSKEFISSFDFIVMQLEIPLNFAKYAAKLAKELNKIVILNPSPALELDKEFLSCVDILIPNEIEIKLIGGIPYILECGVKHIILTLGSKGCELINKKENKIYKKTFKAYKVKAIDTTAAGDSFLGAVVVSLAQGKSLDEAIEFANKVAAISVTRKGAIASIPTAKELKEFDFVL